MNALPVQGMYMNNAIPVTNNINSFLTHTVYEDLTYLFQTIQKAVKKGSLYNPFLHQCYAEFGPYVVRIGTAVYQKNVIIPSTLKIIMFGEKMSKFKPLYEITHSTLSTLYLHIHSTRHLNELFEVGDPSLMKAFKVTLVDN